MAESWWSKTKIASQILYAAGLTEEGYAVERVADGRTASLRLQTETWDLVLLDWWLPAEDGLQVLQRFAAQSGNTGPLLDGAGRRFGGRRRTGCRGG